MGFGHSKRLKQPQQNNTEKQKTIDPEEIAIERIRKSLSHDLETFLLNNIMLSVQFFDNFEREIGALRVNPVSERDAERNSELAEHQRHCLSPERLYEAVAKRVRFRPEHGERSHTYELLHAPRLLVVQDNVDVVENKDTAEYSTVMEIPSYRFTLENAIKNRPGYMKIRAEEYMLSQNGYTTYETIEDDEGVYTCIASDSPEEQYSSRKALGNVEEEEEEENYTANNSSTPKSPELSEGSLMLSEMQVHIERKAPRFPAIAPILKNKDETRKTSIKLQFGPRDPNCDPNKEPSFTLTERRLSGIIKASKYVDSQLAVKTQLATKKRLLSAQSLPNLALPGGSGGAANIVTKVVNSPKNSDSSGYKSEGGSPSRNNVSPPRSHSSDSEYGYATIQELTKPRPLEEHRLGRIPCNTSEIPKECFFTIDVPVYESDDDNEHKYKGKRSLFETRYYLNSVMFMRSFADVFSEKLAVPLGYSSGLDSATLLGTKIGCDIAQNGHDSKPVKIHNEIIPSIFSSIWPEEALKWKTRNRNRVPDPRPNAAYTWPTQPMIDQVQRLGCHLIPLGYMPTRGRNNEQHMEWQLAFPDAERYLETWLTHSQVRCLLFSLSLYKTCLEPLNSPLGLLPSHIRTLLFWQCERNYAAWPEDRPGETLRKFLDKMYDVIMQKNLPDYFIPKRNLFESTPRTHLLKVQEKLLRVRENLVMYLLLAIRNLRYVDSSFYPEFDSKRLYHIITTDNLAILLNPQLVATPKQKQGEDDEESDEEPNDTNLDLWKPVTSKDARKKWKNNVRTQIEIERAAQRLANAPPPRPRRPSLDSIDIKLQAKKGAETLRKKALLEFFIPHFIDIAKKSNSFRATRQAKFYLQHAERLTKLLREIDDAENKAWKYSFEINTVRQAMGTDSSNVTGPMPGPSQGAIPKVVTTTRAVTQTKKLQSTGKKRGDQIEPSSSGEVFKSVNPFRERMELPNQSSLNSDQSSTTKLKMLKVSLPNTEKLGKPSHSNTNNVTVVQVHAHSEKKTNSVSSSLPSSPEIKFDIPANLPASPTVLLHEVVTAESTDF